jgi:hypothetical protein
MRGDVLGTKESIDLIFPRDDMGVDPGNDGVRLIRGARGPSGGRGTSLLSFIGCAAIFVGESTGSSSFGEDSGYPLLVLAEIGACVIGIGGDTIGLGCPITMVDARFGRGGRGPPGRVGAVGSIVLDLLGVGGGGVVSPERDAGALVETSFLGADFGSFSRSLASVAD